MSAEALETPADFRRKLETLLASFGGSLMVLKVEINQATGTPSDDSYDQLRALSALITQIDNSVNPFTGQLVGLKPSSSSELH